MSLEFRVDVDAFKEIPAFLTDVEKKALPKANRNAINRSLTTLREEVVGGIRKRRKLGKGELKKDYMKKFNAKGNKIERQFGLLKISDRPISMIRFVPKSQRNVEDQRGKSIKQRRKLKIEVKPGDKRKTKLFIQKGKGGKLLVFRRMEGTSNSKGKEVMAKQSVAGLGTLMSKVKSIRSDAVSAAERRYSSELPKQLAFFVKKAERKSKRP